MPLRPDPPRAAPGPLTIVPSVWPQDGETVRRLFRRYQAWLQVDLCYQDFEAELAGLPGAYARPRGELFLLRDDAGQAVGCLGLRPLEAGDCELKRLWVEAPARGFGAGRWLVQTAIGRARELGYRRVLLDTLPRLAPALHLYRTLGFVETAPYSDHPLDEVLFLALDLTATRPAQVPETRPG